jgi:hypothetical protein
MHLPHTYSNPGRRESGQSFKVGPSFRRFVLDVRGDSGWIAGEMRIKTLCSLALSTALILSSGCVGTENGASTPGFPTKDTITNQYEKPVPQLVEAARTVLKRNGQLLFDNVVNNTFQAKINQHNVWVRVEDKGGKITSVSVQARGPVGGDIDLASQIATQIALELTAEQHQ